MNALIIDDSKLTRRLVKNVLDECTSINEIYEKNSGTSGLKRIDSDTTIDLVLLDINMPEMNGIEVLTKIRKNSRLNHIKVIMISSESDQDDIKRCLKLGANDYLQKPFTSDALSKLLFKHLTD